MSLLDAIRRFFDEDDWSYDELEDKPVLRLPFSTPEGRWLCYAQARESEQQFVFYSVCPMNIPEDRRIEVMEFLTRANYGMIIGNFEIDLNDGEVRYKTAIDVEGSELTHDLARHLVYANVLTMRRYLKGLLSVGFGGATAAGAIGEIEGPVH